MEDTIRKRPDRDEYYMRIAMSVRSRADCVGNRVGAVLVLDDRIISTGYNGTPANMKNCTDGGCKRCRDRDRYEPGTVSWCDMSDRTIKFHHSWLLKFDFT